MTRTAQNAQRQHLKQLHKTVCFTCSRSTSTKTSQTSNITMVIHDEKQAGNRT